MRLQEVYYNDYIGPKVGLKSKSVKKKKTPSHDNGLLCWEIVNVDYG